jgi:hypothetical protein
MGGGGLFHEGAPKSERELMRERRERFARGERITGGGGRRRGKRVEEREDKKEE